LLASVTVTIAACFATRLRSAYLVAGFSVLYLHVLPLGSAASGIALRIEAVVIGALAATLVNTIVSSFGAERVAARRIRIAKATVADDLDRAASWIERREPKEAPSFDAAFAVVRELRTDLDAAAQERLFPGAPRARESAEAGLRMAESLERAAHLAKEITLLVAESRTRGRDGARRARALIRGPPRKSERRSAKRRACRAARGALAVGIGSSARRGGSDLRENRKA
jgi:uncharacterized membrane protein YgaE (UPF0421/DUF939 family)